MKSYNFIFNSSGELKSFFNNPKYFENELIESKQKTFVFNDLGISEYKDQSFLPKTTFKKEFKKMTILEGSYYLYEGKNGKKLYSILYKNKMFKLLEIDFDEI